MFIKNLAFAFRNFKRNKTTTAINILGLAVGISAAIVIFLIVQYDYSFDKWEPQRENIYRIYTVTGDGENPNSGTSLLAPKAIQQKIPGINVVAHFTQAYLGTATILSNSSKRKFTKWGATVFADENYFNIFPHRWLVGNAASLSRLNSIVLSQSEAEKFFPKQPLNNIVGQTITFDDSIQLSVTGIVADLKQHTDFDNKIFISLKTFMETGLVNSYGTLGWGSVSDASQCLVRVAAHANIADVNKQLKQLYHENQKGEELKYMQIGVLQPLSDVHFNTTIGGKVSKTSLINLGILALLLLLLAAINFINLATARSTLRAKEIGVRKTFGGSNKNIIYQFLAETFLITLFATALAVILSPFLIYVFKGFIPDGLEVSAIFQPSIILFLLIVLLVITLLAGLYPAFVLTRFRPALVLKSGTLNNGKSRSARIRQGLTVFQFVIAQVFLIVVFVMTKQIHYTLNKDLGFKSDAIVSFNIPDAFSAQRHSKKYVLMNELKQIPGIQNISISTGTPILNGYSTTSVSWYNKGKKKVFDNVNRRVVDSNYVNLFKLTLLAGRNVQVDTAAKIADVLINETLLHQMGYHNPQKALGQYFSGRSSDSSLIVGVVKDFAIRSLHNPMLPLIITASNGGRGYRMSLLLNQGNADSWKATLQAAETAFHQYYPDKDFEYTFLDKTIEGLYKSDMRISTLLKWATGLAIFISCLGLLGLVSFMANQRTKEIGIRKVLGASVSQIILLLSKSLLRLVILASVISIPLGWYLAHKWIQSFAFKTELSWWLFVISGVVMLLIALLVLWMKTFKAAQANPVESLKTE